MKGSGCLLKSDLYIVIAVKTVSVTLERSAEGVAVQDIDQFLLNSAKSRM